MKSCCENSISCADDDTVFFPSDCATPFVHFHGRGQRVGGLRVTTNPWFRHSMWRKSVVAGAGGRCPAEQTSDTAPLDNEYNYCLASVVVTRLTIARGGPAQQLRRRLWRRWWQRRRRRRRRRVSAAPPRTGTPATMRTGRRCACAPWPHCPGTVRVRVLALYLRPSRWQARLVEHLMRPRHVHHGRHRQAPELAQERPQGHRGPRPVPLGLLGGRRDCRWWLERETPTRRKWFSRCIRGRAMAWVYSGVTTT
jgi:hypothetical protein